MKDIKLYPEQRNLKVSKYMMYCHRSKLNKKGKCNDLIQIDKKSINNKKSVVMYRKLGVLERLSSMDYNRVRRTFKRYMRFLKNCWDIRPSYDMVSMFSNCHVYTKLL